MKYDVLLFTRGRKSDYSWVYRPEYVDSSVDTLLRALFIAIENQSNRQLFENHGNKNLFFMKERNYCILVYLYFTERYDMAGRRIYALEGLACRKSQCREFWKALPYLIEALYDGTLENRYYFYEEELFSKRESCLTIEMQGADRHIQEEYEDILQKYKHFDYSFLNMVEEMHFTDRMYSFVYGNNAEYLKNRNVERHYQMGESRKKISRQYQSDVLMPELEEEKCRVYFGFGKQGFNYKLNIYVRSDKNTIIMKFPDVCTIERKGISVKKLFGFQNEVEKELSRQGYFQENRVFDEIKKECFHNFNDTYFYERQWNINIVKREFLVLDNEENNFHFRDKEQSFIGQLFQYAYRMKELYFSDGGFHTIYLLNLLSGIWAFFFVREDNQYYFRGIFIGKSEVEQSWLFFEEIMEKYLFPNNRRRTGEFEESYSRFISDMREELQPGNYIISTIPEEYFAKFKNIKIYTIPGMEKLKNHNNLIKKINFSYREREVCDDLYLQPSFFGKKWYFSREEGHEIIKYVCSSIRELSKEEDKLPIKDAFVCDSSDFCIEAEKV